MSDDEIGPTERNQAIALGMEEKEYALLASEWVKCASDGTQTLKITDFVWTPLRDFQQRRAGWCAPRTASCPWGVWQREVHDGPPTWVRLGMLGWLTRAQAVDFAYRRFNAIE